MSKLLILGATGFIGSHLCLAAKNHNIDIIAGVRKESKLSFLQKNNIPYFTFQLDKPFALLRELTNFQKQTPDLDFIIYNVGCTQTLNSQDYYTINFQYLQNFIKALQKLNYFPNKFLFTSSLAVHQSIDNKPIVETSEYAPLTHYGKSKVMAEQFLETIQEFPIIITRPTAVYGPKDMNFLSLIRSLKKHLEIYPSEPTQGLSFVYIDDLVEVYYQLLQQASVEGAYIISDGQDYTAKQLNDIIKNLLNVKTLKIQLPASLLTAMAFLNEGIDRLRGQASIFNRDKVKELTVSSWLCSSQKLQSQTGFQTRFNLEQGMTKTIKWYQQNGFI